MTTPIDLDLVELRCKLRGWHFDRYNYTHRITVWIKGASSIIIYTNGKVTPPHKRLRAKEVDFLMSPRWTLERLLSEPPEGWRIVKRSDRHFHCEWGAWDATSDAEVWGSLRLADPPCLIWSPQVALGGGPEELSRLAERHKAAADLALILAEVEP